MEYAEEYNSHNTKRLSVKEIKDKLLTLDYIRDELEHWEEVDEGFGARRNWDGRYTISLYFL